MFGLGGGMGGMPQPTPEQIEAMQKQMGGRLPDSPAAPAACRRCRRALPARAVPAPARPRRPKLPGLPGLGGFPFGGKKK